MAKTPHPNIASRVGAFPVCWGAWEGLKRVLLLAQIAPLTVDVSGFKATSRSVFDSCLRIHYVCRRSISMQFAKDANLHQIANLNALDLITCQLAQVGILTPDA